MAFWVDALRGTTVIVIIMIVAGGIAYVGDRVGHQVGRKRLTLFGIRPRYTSTIVAIGTGMVIALIVTLVAVLLSKQVQTALFRMNQISAQISELQSRESDLENKVTTGELVQPVGAQMFPAFGIIPKGTAVDKRMKLIKDFYGEAVSFINATYQRLGLKKYTPPADIDRRLQQEFGSPTVTEASQSSDLLMMVIADQNLYRNDEIHFELKLIDDLKRFAKGAPVGYLRIPGGPNANPNLAINELQQLVANIARNDAHLPDPLANNVQVLQAYPTLTAMQSMLKKPNAEYVMTAFAAEDIYPHTGGMPIVVTLTEAK